MQHFDATLLIIPKPAPILYFFVGSKLITVMSTTFTNHSVAVAVANPKLKKWFLSLGPGRAGPARMLALSKMSSARRRQK
jgi:hypothetical protein